MLSPDRELSNCIDPQKFGEESPYEPETKIVLVLLIDILAVLYVLQSRFWERPYPFILYRSSSIKWQLRIALRSTYQQCGSYQEVLPRSSSDADQSFRGQ